jgi:hypothetical protein
LDEARSVIGTLKQPYRTLFTAALYSGMGVGELSLLNDVWPNIRKQLLDGKSVVQINFTHRKTNEKAYFTFCPGEVFEKYREVESRPFVTDRAGAPVNVWILDTIWKLGRKRAGIEKKIRPHFFRDLLHTDGITECEIEKPYLDFLTGHSVDPNLYTQLYEKPDRVQEKWQKWADYIDYGAERKLTGQMQTELEQRDRQIKELQGEIEGLKQSFGESVDRAVAEGIKQLAKRFEGKRFPKVREVRKR